VKDNRRIRVLVCDDENLFREMLVGSLVREEDIEVVGQASTGREAVEKILSLRPDVVLLDNIMPDISGIEVMEAVRSECPQARIAILTGMPDEKLVARALRSGACGFLSKNSRIRHVGDAVRALFEGESFLDPRTTKSLVHSYLARPASSQRETLCGGALEGLTRRELQIIGLLTEGMSNSEIAGVIQVRENTVKKHLTHLFKKLGVRDRVQALAYITGIRKEQQV